MVWEVITASSWVHAWVAQGFCEGFASISACPGLGGMPLRRATHYVDPIRSSH